MDIYRYKWIYILKALLFVWIYKRAKKKYKKLTKGLKMSDKTNIAEHLKLAEEGNMQSQNIVGDYYYNYKSKEHDFEKAFYWYEKAANSGNVEAQYSLGYCYFKGHGTKRNYEKALHWFQLSANSGNELDQSRLDMAKYCLANLTEKDIESEDEYIKNTDENAQTDENGQNSDNTHGQNYYQILKDNGEIDVYQCYQQGLDCIEKKGDNIEGLRFLNISADMGYNSAHYYLGVRHLMGDIEGMDRDKSKAIKSFEKAIDRGYEYKDGDNTSDIGDLEAIRTLSKIYSRAKNVKESEEYKDKYNPIGVLSLQQNQNLQDFLKEDIAKKIRVEKEEILRIKEENKKLKNMPKNERMQEQLKRKKEEEQNGDGAIQKIIKKLKERTSHTSIKNTEQEMSELLKNDPFYFKYIDSVKIHRINIVDIQTNIKEVTIIDEVNK